MKKRCFYTELAYFLGIIFLAFGTAMMTTADIGLSMIVAPAYLLHRKISETFSFFSFGMAEYTFQAFLIILTTVIVRKFKLSYLFSLITAVFYGFILDISLFFFSFIPESFTTLLPVRIGFYVIGFLIAAASISLMFHTYISPEAYELIVKEVSQKYRLNINKFKTIYDCSSCVLAIILSFAFFGMWHFEGISIGTVICTLFNGFLIGCFTKIFEKHFEFKDKFNFRKYFE